MTETEIKQQIRDYLDKRGIFHYNQLQVGKVKYRAKRGVSDIIGMLKPNGRYLAVEVKDAKNKMSPDQEAFAKNVKLNGGLFILARSIEDVMEGLKNDDRVFKK